MHQGVRANNEIVKNMGSSVSVYEELAVQENKVVMDMKSTSSARHLAVPVKTRRRELTDFEVKYPFYQE